MVRAGPVHGGRGTAGLRPADRASHGREEGTEPRARRRAQPGLGQVGGGGEEGGLAGIRAHAEATAARNGGHAAIADRHGALAASYRAMARAYNERETVFAGVTEDRRAWEQATAGKRRTAVAA